MMLHITYQNSLAEKVSIVITAINFQYCSSGAYYNWPYRILHHCSIVQIMSTLLPQAADTISLIR